MSLTNTAINNIISKIKKDKNELGETPRKPKPLIKGLQSKDENVDEYQVQSKDEKKLGEMIDEIFNTRVPFSKDNNEFPTADDLKFSEKYSNLTTDDMNKLINENYNKHVYFLCDDLSSVVLRWIIYIDEDDTVWTANDLKMLQHTIGMSKHVIDTYSKELGYGYYIEC